MLQSPPNENAGRLTAGQEWRLNWSLVLSAMAGLSFGAIPSSTLGLFMDPLNQEFGWSRAEISLGMTIFALISLPLTPFAGALVDRFGARRVAVPGIALTGLTFAGFSLMGELLVYWFSGWVVYTLASLLIRTLVWNTAVSTAFVASRGLALAILLAGMGMTQAIAPPLTNWLIGSFGWRTAYAAIGLGWGGIAFLLVLFLFHVRRSAPLASATGTGPTYVPGGLTFAQAMRNSRILRITAAMGIQSMLGAALVVHIVPLLTSEGLTRGEASGVAAVLGIASVAGKLMTGWLSDRVRSTFLPVSAFALPGLGYFLLLEASGSLTASTVAALLLGYGSGSALHMTTYLTTQYAGIRHFGKIFGVVSSTMALAGGIGPFAAGLLFDVTGAYTWFMIAAIPLALLAGLAVFRLGAYVEFPPEPVDRAAA